MDKENKILLSLYKGIKELIKGLSLKERAEAVCKICVEDLGLSLCWIGKKEKRRISKCFCPISF
jgi:hypothetical protein